MLNHAWPAIPSESNLNSSFMLRAAIGIVFALGLFCRVATATIRILSGL